jgi:hypothetical protein
MCKISEKDKMAVLKHVLCSLMNMSDFFRMKMFNTEIIKKNRIFLTIDRKCTSVFIVPITWSYNSDQWPLAFCTNAHFVVTDILLATHPVTFFVDLAMKYLKNQQSHLLSFAGDFV